LRWCLCTHGEDRLGGPVGQPEIQLGLSVKPGTCRSGLRRRPICGRGCVLPTGCWDSSWLPRATTCFVISCSLGSSSRPARSTRPGPQWGRCRAGLVRHAQASLAGLRPTPLPGPGVEQHTGARRLVHPAETSV